MLKNLTPHAIAIVALNKMNGGTEETITIPPSGNVRVTSKQEPGHAVINSREFSFKTVDTVYGEVEGLPAQEEGVFLIVSAMVLAQCKGRVDIFAPDTGPTAIRDEKGQIKAVRAFVCAPRA